MIRARAGLLTLLAALSCVACGGGGAKRRIVLVTIDTLRADSLVPRTMPRTSAFLAEGLFFPVSFAATSTTQPTHATLLTGLPPWVHGVTRNGVVLAEKHETLAERLHGAGYSTHAVVASFPLHAMFGFEQGFDRYDDEFDVPYVRVWEGRPTEAGTFYSLSESVTRHALDAIDAAQGDLQFFWFHYFDPHDPYGDAVGDPYPVQRLLALATRGDPGLGAALVDARARYERDLGALDRSLGRLLDRLAADEREFETLVVLTADHGESFGEHGALGHGKRLTPEQIEVPLGFVGPRIDPAVRSDVASSEDVATTLLTWAGVDDAGFAGASLFTVSETRSAFGMRRTFVETKEEIRTDGRRIPLPEERFYLARGGSLWVGDSSEVVLDDDSAMPVEGSEADEIRSAFASLGMILERVGTGRELLDEDAQAALRALGYGR